MSEERHDFGLMRLYHPAGVQVSLPLPVNQVVEQTQWAGLLASVTNALAAGWLVNAPGLEEGEEKQEVGYVVHKVKNNEDGTDSDVIDLYANHDGMKFSILTVYLDDDEERRAFERASSMKLDSIPVYVGSDKIERGKSKQADKYVVKAPRPFYVAHKQNPRWSEEESKRAAEQHKGYMVPRRKFSSWPGLVLASQPPTSEQPTVGPSGASEHMLRTELASYIKELGKHTGRTPEQVEADLCKMVGLKALSELPYDRLYKAVEHLRGEVEKHRTSPTKEEIGNVPRAVVDGLLATLKANGHDWLTARKIAVDVLGKPLDKGMTLDDVAKIDNWSAKNKRK